MFDDWHLIKYKDMIKNFVVIVTVINFLQLFF